MRAVEANWYRDFLFNLGRTKNRFDTAISQATSGKKLNHLSDNPSDMSYVLTLRSKIGQIDQFERNIESGKMFLSTGESALNQVQNSMYAIVSLAEQGASDVTDLQGRQTIATQILALRDEIMNYANAEVNGKYIFAGSATDTQPFIQDPAFVFPSPERPRGIIYQGNQDTIDIQADFSITVGSNIPGDQVFMTPINIFDRIDNLVEALRQDNTANIGTEIGNMNELVNQISEATGTIGNRTAHLTQIQGMLKSFKTSLIDKMSTLEDADMAEAISNLGREEVGLNATLQAGARINRTSLMNFLG